MMLMTHLKPCLFKYFSCYGKIDRDYVGSPEKCVLQKSHPLTVPSHSSLSTPLSYPYSSLAYYSWFFLISFTYWELSSYTNSCHPHEWYQWPYGQSKPLLLGFFEPSFHCKYILFFILESLCKTFPSFPCFEICLSPKACPIAVGSPCA